MVKISMHVHSVSTKAATLANFKFDLAEAREERQSILQSRFFFQLAGKGVL
jgi:hypothetical protein